MEEQKKPIPPEGSSPTDLWSNIQKMWLEAMEHFAGGEGKSMMEKVCQTWMTSCQEAAKNFLGVGSPAVPSPQTFFDRLFAPDPMKWLSEMGNFSWLGTPTDGQRSLYEVCAKAFGEVFSRLVWLPLLGPTRDVFGPISNLLAGLSFPTETGNFFIDSYTRSLRPWLETFQLSALRTFQSVDAVGTRKVIEEFYDSWSKVYEETVGKFVKIPAVGPFREYSTKYSRHIDSFIKLCGAWVDFYLKLVQAGSQAVPKIVAKAEEITKDKTQLSPEDYKQIYSLMVEEFEEHFHILFKSPVFCHTLNLVMTNSLEYWTRYQALLEDAVKVLPVPTRSEIDDLYKQFSELKRKVKGQEAVISSLQSAKEPRAKQTKATRANA